MISIIVPVLNEAPRLDSFFEALETQEGERELIIRRRRTAPTLRPKIAAGRGRVVSSSPGRARQMNAGAGVAQGEILALSSQRHAPSARRAPENRGGYCATRASPEAVLSTASTRTAGSPASSAAAQTRAQDGTGFSSGIRLFSSAAAFSNGWAATPIRPCSRTGI